MLDNLKSVGRNLKREIRVYQLVVRDKRTPKLAKLFLGIAVAYALMPFDLIPDFIPVIGYLDDVIILPGLIFVALKMVPKDVMKDCRVRASSP